MACVGTRFLVCFATWFALLVFYILRSNLSVAIIPMASEMKDENNTIQKPLFNWDSVMTGQILGSFFYGYASLHFIGSLVASKIGPRILLSICLFGAGIFTLITPYAAKSGPYFLITCRIIIGLFSSSLYPILQGILGVWTPPSERTILVCLTHSGNIFGIVVNYVVGGILCSSTFGQNGWEYFFYFSGGMALFSFILWLCFGYDSPSKHPCISKRERQIVEGTQDIDDDNHTSTPSFNSIPFSDIFTSGPVWFCTIAHAGSLFIFYSLVIGHAKFLHDVFGLNTQMASFYSTIPFIFNFIGQLIIPPVVDYLKTKKKINITKIRKGVSGIAFLFGSIFIMAVGFFNTNQMFYVILFMTISLTFIGLNNSGYLTASIDIAPQYAGIVMGIMNTFGSIAGFVNSSISGYLSDNKLLGWRYTFIITGFVAFIFGMFFVIFGSSELQSWSQGKQYKLVENEDIPIDKISLDFDQRDDIKVSRV